MKDFYQFLAEMAYFWGAKGGGVLVISNTIDPQFGSGPILIAHRSRQVNEPGTYGLWGGKLDIDHQNMDRNTLKKTAWQAARREFAEESQYTGKLKYVKGSIWANKIMDKRDPNRMVFEYFNYLVTVDRQFAPTLNWETDKFHWWTYDQIMSLPKPQGTNTHELQESNEPGQIHFGLYMYLQKKGNLVRQIASQAKPIS
jgi:ADP-ribose pyrophosphatase YjhB (NUDIX family)